MLKHFKYRLIILLTAVIFFTMASPIFAESDATTTTPKAVAHSELGFDLYSPHILLMEASSRESFV